MKRAEADEVFALFFEDDLLGDDVNDVGALADFVDGVGVDAGGAHEEIAGGDGATESNTNLLYMLTGWITIGGGYYFS